jgi:hypothetical protein
MQRYATSHDTLLSLLHAASLREGLEGAQVAVIQSLNALASGVDEVFTASDAESIQQLPRELTAVRRLEEQAAIVKETIAGEAGKEPSNEVLQVGGLQVVTILAVKLH